MDCPSKRDKMPAAAFDVVSAAGGRGSEREQIEPTVPSNLGAGTDLGEAVAEADFDPTLLFLRFSDTVAPLSGPTSVRLLSHSATLLFLPVLSIRGPCLSQLV